MSSVASPYGLKAVNLIGGLPYAGSTRELKLDPAGYGTNIYAGSMVYVKASGYVEIATATGADATTNGMPVGTANTGIVGVCTGFSYTNSQGQTIFGQYYPANSLNGVAYVVDDPNVVFQVQSAGTVAQSALGLNIAMSVGAVSTGSATTGNSTGSVVAGASGSTTTAVFRIIGFVDMQGISVVGDAFTDILVKVNPGYHSYTNAVGL